MNMNDNRANLDSSNWDPALDAVAAAPKHHKVLFENERIRVLEVTLEPNDEEPIHHHRWPSVFVFDQVQGPIHDFSPDQLERWLMRKLPTIRYLLVDAIDPSSPLSYRHYHDFSFLEGAAEPVFAGAFGEEHRRFILYKVGR